LVAFSTLDLEDANASDAIVENPDHARIAAAAAAAVVRKAATAEQKDVVVAAVIAVAATARTVAVAAAVAEQKTATASVVARPAAIAAAAVALVVAVASAAANVASADVAVAYAAAFVASAAAIAAPDSPRSKQLPLTLIVTPNNTHRILRGGLVFRLDAASLPSSPHRSDQTDSPGRVRRYVECLVSSPQCLHNASLYLRDQWMPRCRPLTSIRPKRIRPTHTCRRPPQKRQPHRPPRLPPPP
jgi:hypothetical protein